ncbi:MAG TPA: tRNA pseudouridine(55) synthase TruB [Candidatus Eisenbacteria bacterium]|nr:tRNA pseudouridine(55) synthase TruB [Candidatus Eisenbacteria bacterium]
MNASGVLLIDKPEGPSSAQVVRRVKRILGAKRVGHLGTLDPFASGLLPLGINEGTKVASVFLNGIKTYSGAIALGIETDTQDLTGRVTQVRPIPPFGEPELRALEGQFTGAVRQVPPMFSALKKEGVRLYELARQGREIPRAARTVHISNLRLRKSGADAIEFDVTCSRGTYVRTLAADLGNALGCGAHLKRLRRIACDHLSLEQAISPDEVERLKTENRVPLIGLESALSHLPLVVWDSRKVLRLRRGQQQMLSDLPAPRGPERLMRVQDESDRLVALVEWNEEFGKGHWQLLRVFQ